MGRLVNLFAILLAALSIVAAPAAVADIDIQPVGSVPIPAGPAEAWIVADMDTGQVLAGRNDNTRYAPASTIKTLLAQVVLDEVPLESTVVADEADTSVECNCAGVAPGQVYTARQLLEALLLVSGNDAANTLARTLGGMDTAVAKMNAKAAVLGAHGTNVVTPSGLDAPGMPFWSTPHDLAVIFRAAMAHPVFAQITAMPSTVFPTKTGDTVLVNQNELLHRYPGAIGGKTGFTDIARKTFVGAAHRDGRRLVVVLMHGLVKEGGPTYWDQAAGLLDWGFGLDRGASVGAL
ncbi:D-alanyl-D-alanine carboxypeptidase [Mycolicibacterium doricum]|uniref:D-alanyl-D-alanine carboxypeptidase n=1 Tax=Mycolicibacterium doricum TaxID=126673 RepID=A0A1X1TFT8_9MYCO|nr:D-alanyl-D-alanine carboxypeptidase family protein [Mycolicibacterium doricum]MCV7266710.1 D-alanyl-D-alanine carboxypeptidase [Mycolicibacterium doricum]ORV43401.1 D-alanyl-D-alanine carboxypeptidase [Mycolicibacterium doricum]BBZ07181.1 D-alanyl-D-alanine carboxypeptidase [Mycolicibacterium doricum]